jgi:3-phytase
MVFRREGEPGKPHDHSLLASIPTTADQTDGIEVTATPLPGFPKGTLVMMNSGPRNFLIYQWTAVVSRLATRP